jgi:hypothetical protein
MPAELVILQWSYNADQPGIREELVGKIIKVEFQFHEKI